MADCIRKVHKPIVDGQFRVVLAHARAEREVGGRGPCLKRGRDFAWKLRIRVEDDLDLLAGLLLESGDSLSDSRVRLGAVSVFPPQHEVGGLRAERRLTIAAARTMAPLCIV